MLAHLTIALLLGAASAEAPTLPSPLTLPQAEEIFLEHGLDLLVVEAQARGAEGDLRAAGAHPNPGLNVALMFGPGGTQDLLGATGTVAQSVGLSFGVTDNAAIEDMLSGKHSLRIQASAKALASAQQGVEDLKRNELSQLRQAFAAVLLGAENLDFAHDVQKSYDQTYDLNGIRYKKGDISRSRPRQDRRGQARGRPGGDAGRARTGGRQGLAWPSCSACAGRCRNSRSWAHWSSASSPALPARAPRPSWHRGLPTAPTSRSPPPTASSRRPSSPRPAASSCLTSRCSSAIRSSATAPECSSAPTFNVGLQSNLPIFYQQQGEIRRAESNLAAATASEAKARAQVLSDVTQGWAGYRAARELVDRMEKAELKQAKLSRDLEELMYRKGAASLLDFLDAERTYIATNLEYRQDLAAYWDAVYQLEQATAVKLR